MKYKIVGFTKFPDNQDYDCIAITEKGEEILVDPFVSCAFDYEKREHLLGVWFETKDLHWHKNTNVLMPAENDFHIIQKNISKESKFVLKEHQKKDLAKAKKIVMEKFEQLKIRCNGDNCKKTMPCLDHWPSHYQNKTCQDSWDVPLLFNRALRHIIRETAELENWSFGDYDLDDTK